MSKEQKANGEAFMERVLASTLGALDVATIHLGDRLGYYAVLAAGPTTSVQLAEQTATDERYAREWLEQQAVVGIIGVVDGVRGADGSGVSTAAARQYVLPAGYDSVLLDREHLAYLAPLARITVAMFGQLPQLVEAFRSGQGVAYADYGAEAREAQMDQNRPLFAQLLGSQWVPAMGEIHERLMAQPAGRVLDLACGAGWSTIALAEAYPDVLVDGVDVDAPSIALAEQNLAGRAPQLAHRVRFTVADDSAAESRRYDVAFIYEALHDMSQPVPVLRSVRSQLVPGASLVVVDERVADTFTAPGDDMERLFYGYSVLFCLPTGRADQPSVGTGTVMRTDTLRRYAEAAGFTDVDVLPIESDLWRFYRLRG